MQLWADSRPRYHAGPGRFSRLQIKTPAATVPAGTATATTTTTNAHADPWRETRDVHALTNRAMPALLLTMSRK